MSEEAKNKIRSLKRNWDTDQDDKFGGDLLELAMLNTRIYRIYHLPLMFQVGV